MLSAFLQSSRFFTGSASLLAAFFLAGCAGEPPAPPEPADYLILNGEVYAGDGAAPLEAAIAVRGERIEVLEVGETLPEAGQVIDARGLIVAPGFVDPHTHAGSDLLASDPARRRNDNYLFQGVTTVFIGNDGDGTSHIAGAAGKMREAGIGTNVAMLVGFGHVRSAVLGQADVAPTADELAEMQGLVRAGMCEGAFGFSTGLHYTPQNFAHTDEVIALMQVAAPFGGLYDSHIRDESSYREGVLASIEEAVEIGRQSGGAPVHIAHIKALGPDVWGFSDQIIDIVEAARAEGLDVTADQYPWTASGTRVSNALVPRWAMDGGLEGFRARITDPDIRPGLLSEMEQNLRRRAGPEAILLTAPLGEADPALEGKTLAEAAGEAGLSPIDMALEILMVGDSRIASFVMDEGDIANFAVQDWVMTGSDGSSGHPRKYATYPAAYQGFVRTHGLFDLSWFIRRSSGLVADTYNIPERGYLRDGYIADIVVFDPEGFQPRADYQHPRELSVGVDYLFVNGELAIAEGAATEALAGDVLLHDLPEGTCVP